MAKGVFVDKIWPRALTKVLHDQEHETVDQKQTECSEIDSDPWYTCYGLLHSEYGTLKPESLFVPITVYTAYFPMENKKRESEGRERENY